MEQIADLEDMSAMALDAGQIRDLVGESGTCILSWTTRDGYPVGVAMGYVFRDGAFWMTTPAWRKRVRALSTRPKSCVTVIKDGSSATFKGESVIHGPADPDWPTLTSWFYAALSGTERDPADVAARTVHRLLDSPNRVIIETRAHLVTGFDWRKFEAAIGAAITATANPSS
jgi:hypothetical protein